MPIFGRLQKSCGHCGKDIGANAKFCPYCGQPAEATLGTCPHCGQRIAANARFCPSCGRLLGGERTSALRGNVWRKSPDELATRVEPANLREGLYKELEVQPGQQVIILVDGRAEESRVGPGRYTIDSFFDRLLTLGTDRRATALLIDGGFTILEFQLPKLYTRDDYEVSGRCVIRVQIAKPEGFFINVMKSERSVTIAGLRSFLFDGVRDAAQDMIGRSDFRGLATGLDLKDQMAVTVEQHLSETLTASGLHLRDVPTIEVAHPRLDSLRRQWEEIRIGREQAEADSTQSGEQRRAEVAARQDRWEAQLATETQETAEQRGKAHTFEERAQVWEEAQRAIFSDQMNQVRTNENFRDFLAKINRRQLLSQEQLDAFAEDFARHKGDLASARAHVAYLAELERDYNRKQAELVWKTDFTLDQMASALKIMQLRLVHEGALDERRWRNDLAALLRSDEKADWQRAEQQKQEVFDRQREKDAHARRLEIEKAQALHRLMLRAIETDADLTDAQKRKRTETELQRYETERRSIQRHIEAADFNERQHKERTEDEEDMRLASEALDLLTKMKQNRLTAEEQVRRIAREDELTRADAALKADLLSKDAEHPNKAQVQAHELAMFQARGQMSAEALMSLSGPDQARTIADLKKTEAMKGMSDEEVYAMMAAQSPAVAQALAERFKAMAARPAEVDAPTRALYERILADIGMEREKETELRRRTEERFQRMFDKAMENQGSGMVDNARATGDQPPAQSGPVIIMNPTTGQPQVIQTGDSIQASGGTGKVQVCPRCRVKSPVGERFCANCGQEFA